MTDINKPTDTTLLIQTPEKVVERQLNAYNTGDFHLFASCYHPDIISYDFATLKLNAKMSGLNFFAHYRKKFEYNPNLHCNIIQRMSHANLVIDKELISAYNGQSHTEMVVYQVDNGIITKMWFSSEIPENEAMSPHN